MGDYKEQNAWPLEQMPNDKQLAAAKKAVEDWFTLMIGEVPTQCELFVHRTRREVGEKIPFDPDNDRRSWRAKRLNRDPKSTTRKYWVTEVEYRFSYSTSWGFKGNIHISPWKRNQLEVWGETQAITNADNTYQLRRFADLVDDLKAKNILGANKIQASTHYCQIKMGQRELNIKSFAPQLKDPPHILWGLMFLCQRATLAGAPAGDFEKIFDDQPYRQTTTMSSTPGRYNFPWDSTYKENPERWYTHFDVGYRAVRDKDWNVVPDLVKIRCPFKPESPGNDAVEVISVETHHRGTVHIGESLCERCSFQLECLTNGAGKISEAELTSSRL